MTFSDYLRSVRFRLITSHAAVLPFFAFPQERLDYRPEAGGWTVAEILEHIGLTSHYLLIIIDKSALKARRKASGTNLAQTVAAADPNPERLQNISRHRSFAWSRPEHMEPNGLADLQNVQDQLVDQLQRCLNHLQDLEDGAGLLHTTTMTVDNLGRLNVYEYIDFLARHVERHLTQIRKTLNELPK
ncbi:DinB family protein [Neolewinella persica]|uniref:DinB family protein n=1 Tax=Neolewinella persica TaxID=70998 RepID=UPI00146E048A|nr:DinB family protein [Neolewinella persica]